MQFSIHTHIFYKKLSVWACTESFLKFSDVEFLEFLVNFIKGSITIFLFTEFLKALITIFVLSNCSLVNISKLMFLKLFQCSDIIQVPAE